jgi:predicted nucleotidyltransferase component of viral defense system
MSALTPLQVATLRLFFGLLESSGFLLAGGAALIAQELTARPTHDLDFFSAPGGGSIAKARSALTRAAIAQGWQVDSIQDVETFCRLKITGMEETLIVDLAVDASPLYATITTHLGPSYAPEELAGRKTIALFDRAEARDFADVYLLAQRFGRQTLVARAAEVDGGFDNAVFASMLGTLDRFTDEEVPVQDVDVATVREYFKDWARELGDSER